MRDLWLRHRRLSSPRWPGRAETARCFRLPASHRAQPRSPAWPEPGRQTGARVSPAPIRPRFGMAAKTTPSRKSPEISDFRAALKAVLPAGGRTHRFHQSSTMNSGDFKDCASSGTVAILPTRVRFPGDFRDLAETLQLIPITHISLPDVVSTGITGHYSLTRSGYLH